MNASAWVLRNYRHITTPRIRPMIVTVRLGPVVAEATVSVIEGTKIATTANAVGIEAHAMAASILAYEATP